MPSNDKKTKEKKFRCTTAHLSQLGYVETSPGVWGRPTTSGSCGADIQNHTEQPSSPKLERSVASRVQGKAAHEGKGEGNFRYRIRVTSHRTRLIDWSNFLIKWIEDKLTEHGVIPDDSPEFCDQPIFRQKKCKKGEEKTVIEVFRYIP